MGFTLTWKVGEFIWSGNFVDSQGTQRKVCIVRVVWLLFLLKKWKYAFSACYNEMAMERSQCRGGGAN